jgi:hypothetical protein
VVATAIVYMKREALAPYLPKSAKKKTGNGKARGKNKNKKGGQRYKRVKK